MNLGGNEVLNVIDLLVLMGPIMGKNMDMEVPQETSAS